MKKVLVIALALCLILSLAACGSGNSGASAGTAEKVFTIGICQLVQHPALDLATQGFKDAVTAGLGADKVRFDEQNASGDSATCTTICTGYVASNVDLIMANATPALQAAVSATTTIPILGTSVTDYGEALAIEMDAAKGTGINVAGSSDGMPAQLYADLVTELIPDAKTVHILYCSSEANSVFQANAFIACMDAKGIATEVFTFADSNDIQAVCTAAAENCDAMYIPTDNQAATNITIIRNITEAKGLPVVCGEESMCKGGCLATVSISYYDIGKACGEQAVKILKEGADIKTMPIAYATDPVKEFNADYAAAIGFTMPEGFTAIE